MTLPLLRPAQLADLDKLIQFSQDAGYGITSLPRNGVILEKKLTQSICSFQKSSLPPTHEPYLFCLEYEKKVIGISGITSRIGMSEPFFAYHKVYEPHTSEVLNTHTQIPLFQFVQARKKPTEIGTLFLEKAFRKKDFGKLLSLGRFLFIATFRERFASVVIAEIRGVNHEGNSPFWESVGKHFFQTDFIQADRLRTEHPECIEELYPTHSLYIQLLSQEATDVIGIPHKETIAAKKMLEDQGFQSSNYYDLFDAGPHLYAPTDSIQTITDSKTATIEAFKNTISSPHTAFISNTQLNFRATIAPIEIGKKNGVILETHVAEALQVKKGELIRYYI
ncbi:MAG: Arginine N-succinyltransferase [Chlamydiales bacterium]|nr:Arginine N-succinyltransferase [Chlamydiales bacterium]